MKILVFDFEAPGSDYEHRAREQGRFALAPEQADRAADLWPILAFVALRLAGAAGDIDRPTLAKELNETHGLRFGPHVDLRGVHANLTDAAKHALDDIRHQVGGVRLPRTEAIEHAEALLEPSRMLQIVGEPGVGKSAVLKHLAERLTPEGSIIVLAPGRIVAGGWLAFAHQIGCPQTVSRDQLFNELGCSGGATLFIDNIDQIDDEGEWATLRDLLRGVVANPGWRTVITAWSGSSEWQRKLALTLRSRTGLPASIAPAKQPFSPVSEPTMNFGVV